LASSAAVLLAGCVLVVTPEAHGEHCRFAAEDTACGRCLRARCEPAIDACCTDDGCSGALALVDACSRGEAGACESLGGRSSAAVTSERDVGACAATRCAAVCRTFTGASQTACREPSFGRGATCACNVATGAAPANDFDCSSTSYPGTVCCAPSSWPAPGLECSCRPLGCSSTPEGCFCHLVDTPPESQSCEAANCCASFDQCACRDRCFLPQERVVARCAAPPPGTTEGCAEGQKRVDSCSIRE